MHSNFLWNTRWPGDTPRPSEVMTRQSSPWDEGVLEMNWYGTPAKKPYLKFYVSGRKPDGGLFLE